MIPGEERCPKCGERERRTIHPSICREEGGQIVSRPASSLLSQSAMCIPPQLNPGCENSTGKLSAAEPRTKTDSPNLSYRVTEACAAATCENGHKFRGIQYNPSLFLPHDRSRSRGEIWPLNDTLIWTICHSRRRASLRVCLGRKGD